MSLNLTSERLIAAGIGPTQAKTFAEPFRLACEAYGVSSVAARAMLLSQCMHESAKFTRLEENLFYTKPEWLRQVFPSRITSMADAAPLCRNPQRLANRVYSGRLGNGDEASGDGWKYRGRGLIQLTGRANYREAGYEDNPEEVAQPTGACRTAAWFFVVRGCVPFAEASNVEAVTRIINGPKMLGLAERKQLFQECVEALS